MTEPAATLSDQDKALLEQFRQGSRRALARLITRVDNGEDVRPFLQALEAKGEDVAPKVVGITGPPGAGKSSLIGCLIPEIRKRNMSVAVLAVDPESPFTGGAILGDRIRMGRHFVDDSGVYIRSLSSRGSAGGLSRSTRSVCRLLTAFGFDLVLLETVGAGQAELSVMDASDLVLLVLVPGTGDAIQWEKAGQVEIADVFALNKADLPGIDALESQLRSALESGFMMQCPTELKHGQRYDPTAMVPITKGGGVRNSLWDGVPPVIRTMGNEGEGVGELLNNLLEGLRRLGTRPDPWRSPIRRRLRAGLEEDFERRMRLLFIEHGRIEELTEQVRLGQRTMEDAMRQAWKWMM
jgi:LAO/AO transport system kinase